MKLEFIENEIGKLKLHIDFKRRNDNELYVRTSPEDAKDMTNFLIAQHKLNFIAEFCKEEQYKDSSDDTPIDKKISQEDFKEKPYVISIILSGRKSGYYVIISYETKDSILSIQGTVFQSHLFEREISDLYGLKIEGCGDCRHLVKHEDWPLNVFPLKKDFPHGTKLQALKQVPPYEFRGIYGDVGYQIPVGPVHAGIIEPGHFRFSVVGEPIENLEIRLMYKHRGIEKLCENISADKLNLLVERISGESSVAYAECYALLVEKLLGFTVPIEVQALRVVLLELERSYNFLDDIAGICVDIGFSYPAKKFSYFSEKFHQLCERVTGSRYLRNSIIPCGNNINFTFDHAQDILETLDFLKKRFNKIVNATLNDTSFLDRVETTGIVDNSVARKYCLTGVVARASGIHYDARCKFPYEIYKDIKTSARVCELGKEELGGVFERYKLKIDEIADSFNFIEAALDYIGKDMVKFKKPFILEENLEALVSVETVKGELVVYGQTGKDNKFNRIYFKTPSFTNWNGLTQAVLGEIVPDFPLCNKSFNMSYSENDR